MKREVRAIDPVEFHTIRNYLSRAVREMSVAVTRTAYSTMISGQGGAIGDTEAAILHGDGSLLATDEAQIVHMASLPTGLRYVLEEFPLETVNEGDIYINNHPHRGAIHSNDTMIFRPVFVEGTVGFWCAVMAHLTDLGGMAPGGMAVQATSIFAEGLVIPPSKLVDRGVRNDTIISMIAANSRQPEETVGDLLALIAGSEIGSRRIRDLLTRYEWGHLSEVIDEHLDYTERITRANIQAMPDGVYHGSSQIDDDGIDSRVHYTVRATVTIKGDEIDIDLAGSSAQARGSINSSYAQSLTAVTYAVRCYVGREVALNEGMWRPMRIHLPHGSIVNPRHPGACNTRMANTTPSIVEAVLWALSPVAPADLGRIAGGGVPDVHGVNPRNSREYWLHWEAGWGGGGARDCVDGVDGGGTPMRGGMEAMIPVESCELAYDLRCESFRRRIDSGGPGKYRGGLGVEKVITFLTDCSVSARTDRWLFPPAGRDGGSAGAPGAYVLNRGSDDEVELPSKFADLAVKVGDRFTFATVGGGGFGDPMTRDPEAVLHDVLLGRVSREGAEGDYGVVIEVGDDGSATVDYVETAKRRESKGGA